MCIFILSPLCDPLLSCKIFGTANAGHVLLHAIIYALWANLHATTYYVTIISIQNNALSPNPGSLVKLHCASHSADAPSMGRMRFSTADTINARGGSYEEQLKF